MAIFGRPTAIGKPTARMWRHAALAVVLPGDGQAPSRAPDPPARPVSSDLAYNRPRWTTLPSPTSSCTGALAATCATTPRALVDGDPR